MITGKLQKHAPGKHDTSDSCGGLSPRLRRNPRTTCSVTRAARRKLHGFTRCAINCTSADWASADARCVGVYSEWWAFEWVSLLPVFINTHGTAVLAYNYRKCCQVIDEQMFLLLNAAAMYWKEVCAQARTSCRDDEGRMLQLVMRCTTLKEKRNAWYSDNWLYGWSVQLIPMIGAIDVYHFYSADLGRVITDHWYCWVWGLVGAFTSDGMNNVWW